MNKFSSKNISMRVDVLMEKIEPKAGDVYLHQDIAHIANTAVDSNEYRCVIQSWRRRLWREKNIDLDSVRGMGYRVLNDNERVGVGVKDFSRSVRRMDRAVSRIERADAALLDDQHRRQQDHAKRLRELVNTGRNERKSIAISGNVVALPKRAA